MKANEKNKNVIVDGRTNEKGTAPRGVCPKCFVCGEFVDRSDAQETFGSISRKGWTMNDKYIPSVRYLLCGNCILDVTAKIREMQIIHRPAIKEGE